MSTRQLRGVCHHDVPQANDDIGASIHQHARETCGFDTTRDLFNARREVEANGGPEGVLRNIIRKIERGQR